MRSDNRTVEQEVSQGPGNRAINILVVYPRVLTGQLITESLSYHNFQLAGHASSADAAVAYLAHTSVDVVLIGENLIQAGDGIEVLRRIRTEVPGIRVVMLLENPVPQAVIDAFRFGARGVFCMSGNDCSRLLWRCIQCVHNGQIWANSEELHWVMNSLQNAPAADCGPLPRASKVLEFRKLSRREEDVVKLVADGLSNRDIARNLNLSENTIKNYLFRIFGKVGVSNRSELLLHALEAVDQV